MRKAATITILIIFAVVTIGLLIGYETYRLISALKENKELTTQIEDALKQKFSLQKDLAKINLDLKAAKEKLRPLAEELAHLQDALGAQTLQEVKLQKQLSQTQSDIPYLKDQITKYKNKIKELNDTLKTPRQDKASFERTNRKLKKDALVKELEEANIKIDALIQANNFMENQVEEANLSKKSLEDELDKIKGESLKQGETNVSLSETIAALKSALDEKDKAEAGLRDELNKVSAQGKSLESELLSVKTALVSKGEELKQKMQDLDGINMLYNNLKIQFPQISNLLTQKELELDSAQRELIVFKEELAIRNQEKETLQSQLQIMDKNLSRIQSKYQGLQTEFNLARQQHKKMVDELNKAAQLNASLQQSLVGLAQSVVQEEEEKEKAMDLRNKVEVILTPQENKE